jgi:hypothetical protein
LSVLPLLLLAGACTTAGGGTARGVDQPGHGAITVEIVPNPIVAHHISDNEYIFAFDVLVRETGGHAVTISRLTAGVRAFGGIPIASENYDTARIDSLGYARTVPANGELRYHFAPRKSVPDERLFSGVSAELRVDAVDDGGISITARTTVTVTR